MAGRNQQDRIDKGGVWPFGIIRIKERDVKGDGVNEEPPLVLKRKPDDKSSGQSLAPRVITNEGRHMDTQLITLLLCYHLGCMRETKRGTKPAEVGFFGRRRR